MEKENKFRKFFNLTSIEETIKKKECTKTFEDINLFNVTRKKVALFILSSLVIMNLLIVFEFNKFYIRPIITFLFLLFIPGLILMFSLKIRKVKFWEYLVYTIGLSISFIVFGGLTINWILPFLDITHKPLSTIPILTCFNLFLIILGTIAWKRNRDLKSFKVTMPKLDAINHIFFIIPISFPAISILGAFLLNNFGPNLLSMILLGNIATYILFLTIFKKHLNENVYPWALWMIGLSLLLSFSMRSWYINGWDNFLEYYVFNLAKNYSVWEYSRYISSYNTCLSLTILPILVSLMSNIKGMFVFKLLFQIIFSFTPLIVFIFSRRHFSLFLAFLSSLIFMIPIGFVDMTALLRQEISFLFFGLSILILTNRNINKSQRTILFLIFGASIIVSHYSTSYITLALLLFVTVLNFLFHRLKPKKIRIRKEVYLRGILILILIIFGFFWYSQISSTSDGLTETLKNSFSNLNNLFNEELMEEGSSIFNQLNPFYSPSNSLALENYVSDIYETYDNKAGSAPYYDAKNVRPIYSKIVSNKININYVKKIFLINRFLVIFLKILIFLGFFVFIFNNKISIEERLILLVFILFLIMMITLPVLSINYNLGRFYQQGLMLLSTLTVGGMLLFYKIIKKGVIFALTIILILLLLFTYGFIPQLKIGRASCRERV